jgi:hypothetical protein
MGQAACHRCNCWIGTWKLDLTKSRFDPGMAPREVTLKYEDQAGALHMTLVGIDNQGNPMLIEFTAKTDGTPSPSQGSPAFDTVTVKRIDCRTIDITFNKPGQPARANRTVVSKDCRELTDRATGQGDQGVAIYYRE